jgi:hemolysin activation/secretion protein
MRISDEKNMMSIRTVFSWGLKSCSPVLFLAVCTATSAAPVLQFIETRVFNAEANSSPQRIYKFGKVEQTLQSAAQEKSAQWIGQPMTTENLMQWSTELTDVLRRAGYPIGRVAVTTAARAQADQTGKLIFEAYLGEIGKLDIQNETRVSDQRLRRTLETALCEPPTSIGKGCLLETQHLERATQLARDLPSVNLEPPTLGADEVGLGQTHMRLHALSDSKPHTVQLSADNYGSAPTGLQRYGASVAGDNVLLDGSTYLLAANTTPRDLVSSTASFSAPLDYAGWRWSAALSRATYSINENVRINGIADTLTLGLIYPFVRGLDRNLHGALDALTTRTSTEFPDFAGAQNHTSLQSVRTTLQGDSGDRARQLDLSFSTWNVALTLGHQKNDDPLDVAPKRAGHYTKMTYGVTRKQNFRNTGDLFGILRLHGQYANKNLDNSEKLTLGGITGARAFRTDEGVLDNGVALSLDMKWRKTLSGGHQLLPGVLLDGVNGQVNRRAWSGWEKSYPITANVTNTRTLADYGVSLDWISPQGIHGAVAWAHRFRADKSWQLGTDNSRLLASLQWGF